VVTTLIFYVYGTFVFLVVTPEMKRLLSGSSFLSPLEEALGNIAESDLNPVSGTGGEVINEQRVAPLRVLEEDVAQNFVADRQTDEGLLRLEMLPSIDASTLKQHRSLHENRDILWGFAKNRTYDAIYFVYVVYIGIPTMFVFHIFFILHLAAFYNAILTDPGLVPPNWGFYMGDETKRRRYCKMCNVWKPDRTHHCSLCSRCILNMDHHCPWINNCVGFYNRKFFMQFVVYVWLCLAIVITYSLPILLDKFLLWWSWLVPDIGPGLLLTDSLNLPRHLLMVLGYIVSLALGCTLYNFMKFHIKLISENFTTIENIEREENAKSRYDIGVRRNWEQVFGPNLYTWWIPAHTQASRPIGDGVRWRVHYTRVIDEDEELMNEEDTAQNRQFLK